MANNFSKEERVAFEQQLEAFQDMLVISRNVATYRTNAAMMERSNDTIWRPMPYIVNSQDRVIGSNISFQEVTQLSVPSTLGFKKTVGITLDALELRDQLQEGRLGKSSMEELAIQVNQAVRDTASLTSTIAVAVATAPGDYDDIALCESAMTELGVPTSDRYLALSTRDYNGLAGNLASRQTMQGKPTNAYERSYVGPVAGFETYKLDVANRCNANAATVTIDTTGSQVQYVPTATTTAAGGQTSNHDNRYQTVTFNTTAGMAAGDVYTIDGIESVHMREKTATGQPKTFRVISVLPGGTQAVISPPMIGANQANPTDAELAYKNIEVVSTSATAAVTFLNTTASSINPFWHKSSIELLPGRFAVPRDGGVDVMSATTDNGIEVIMTKWFNHRTFVTEYSFNTLFGVVNTNPEMNGILLFNQS